jgi:putative addiction module component (TIGR02574 family)
MMRKASSQSVGVSNGQERKLSMSQSVSQLLEASKALSAEEQMELFDALWEVIDQYAAPDEFGLTPEQRVELDRRWEEHVQHPENAISWEEGKAKLAALRDRP